MEKTALIIEGGAMRGIFACGILDAFIERDFFPFDLCIGVSAGASNAASYLARMRQRNYKVYTDYSLRPEFINPWRALRGGHWMDLDWMWEITARELPMDTDTLFNQQCEFLATVTCSQSGRAEYLRPNADNLFEVLKASSALPLAYRNTITIDGRQWADGGVADSIPVREAYRRGARKILVLRSQVQTYTKKPSRAGFMLQRLMRETPALADAMQNRASSYQSTLDFIRQPPADAQIIEICPPDNFPVGRTTTDWKSLHQGYEQGLQRADSVITRWETA